MPVANRVAVPLTTTVTSVRAFSQESGRSSFHYFVTAILGTSVPDSVYEALAALQPPQSIFVPKHELRKAAHAVLLWSSILKGRSLRISIQGLEVDPPALCDSVRWLFGNVRIVKPVTWAPDIILTCERQEA